MAWFWPFKKKTRKLNVQEIKFIGEQDGPNERLLKEKLIEVIRGKRSVSRAYLARATYNSEGDAEVVLALKTPDRSNRRIVKACAEVLRSIAPADVHLDIVFLSETMEQELAKVCKPFYELTKL